MTPAREAEFAELAVSLRAGASPAMQHALDRIVTADGLDGEFGLKAFHRNRKRRVRRVMRAGPSDYETQLRYAWLGHEAVSAHLDLDQCLTMMAHVLKTYKRSGRAVRLYANSFRMMNGETIFIVRVILRWLRRHEPSQLPYVLGALTTESRVAAE